ncbi:hypothetical protein CAI21_00325 [Alkalilimnicola ehrlichii]|uniref:Uncharacterized protein n=1 Tax=Alkalilimnicola ehrlichii TaxID=351052 RepID=A0A3E0X1T4_9GAMM|nr:OmpW family outer membrane protein [Alkalilimnicola ehrlichii]RFA31144.1 hypothetical protein CAI21_00325 [Alkalilimnicola ehrlichii]RFA39571.1 hypothetical protein CAL65_02080 [Alkalilimnicola ehrlichii]
MKKYLAVAAAMGFAPALVSAQVAHGGGAATMTGPVEGDREITLFGSGRSDVDFDNNTISVNGSFAQYLTDEWSLGVRQGIDYIDRPDESSIWQGSTALFTQWHFGAPDAMVRPFVGVNFGGFYGDNLTDTWAAGPEVGAKWYVQPQTFILTQVDYQFTFRNADDLDEDWDDGRFNYHIGVGYNF